MATRSVFCAHLLPEGVEEDGRVEDLRQTERLCTRARAGWRQCVAIADCCSTRAEGSGIRPRTLTCESSVPLLTEACQPPIARARTATAVSHLLPSKTPGHACCFRRQHNEERQHHKQRHGGAFSVRGATQEGKALR